MKKPTPTKMILFPAKKHSGPHTPIQNMWWVELESSTGPVDIMVKDIGMGYLKVKICIEQTERLGKCLAFVIDPGGLEKLQDFVKVIANV